jgi:hypothetical protein
VRDHFKMSGLKLARGSGFGIRIQNYKLSLS